MYKKTLAVTVIILSVIFAGNALAGTKFLNKDTAKNRQDNHFGTNPSKTGIKIESNKDANRITITPKDEEEDQDPNQPAAPIFVTPEIKIERD